MKEYIFENIYILKGTLAEEEAQKEIKKINNCYKGAKKVNEIIDKEQGFLGKKCLAYEIKGEKEAYFFSRYFKGTYKRVCNIEKTLRNNNNVLKFMTIKIEI